MKLESIVGVTAKDVYPEQFARPYRDLGKEFQQGFTLIRPRLGYSPRVGSLKVNEACQFNCTHCYANKAHGREMTTKEVFDVEEKLARGGIEYLDLTGGEPILREDLPQIIAHSHELGMLTTLNTNGGIKKNRMVEEYAYWHELAEAGLFGAYFSYDDVGQKTDPRVIHLAAFLVNTLHIFGGIRTVVTQDNLDKVYGIGRTCMRNNIFFQAVPAVALDGESSASPDDFHPLDDKGREEFINIIHNLSKVRGPFARFLRVQNAYLNKVVASPDPNSAWHCNNPSKHWIFVDAQGKARVCNDRALPGDWSFIGEENPLLDKKFHEAVEKESKKCGGCSWYCNWEANRRQLIRGMTEFRYFATMGSLT